MEEEADKHKNGVVVTKEARECTWVETDGQVVVSMQGVRPISEWTNNGAGGITWRAGDSRTWIDKKGAGELCFKVIFTSTGAFYLTARTTAPHRTEHNDMFLKFSGGLDLFRAGTHEQWPVRDPMMYFKAYQNYGQDRMADIISSIDYNPHIFVTRPVERHVPYQVCISGRSSMFSVFDLVFIKCTHHYCARDSGYIRSEMESLNISLCL